MVTARESIVEHSWKDMPNVEELRGSADISGCELQEALTSAGTKVSIAYLLAIFSVDCKHKLEKSTVLKPFYHYVIRLRVVLP